MNFWISLVGYQLVWLVTVTGAGHGLSWPGLAGLGLYASWHLTRSLARKADIALIIMAVMLGLLLDGGLLHFGLVKYSPDWPLPAALLGAIGGPLAYLGAARGWHVTTFAEPIWLALLWLASGGADPKR